MAAHENNEKYVAEAWINDGKDEEFKTSFLENMLQQLQGHKDTDGAGFDADKVDGMHYYDIHKEIIDRTVNLLSEIKIGNVYYNSENNDSELPFDVIHLNVEGHDYYGDNQEKYQLNWAVEPGQDSNHVNLNMVFAKLYDMLQAEIEASYTQEEMDTLKETLLDPLDKFMTDLVEAGSVTEDGKVNASAVNGLSFYVKTLAEYNELKKTEKGLAMINNQRNIFIIKDIPPLQLNELTNEEDNDNTGFTKYYLSLNKIQDLDNFKYKKGFTVGVINTNEDSYIDSQKYSITYEDNIMSFEKLGDEEDTIEDGVIISIKTGEEDLYDLTRQEDLESPFGYISIRNDIEGKIVIYPYDEKDEFLLDQQPDTAIISKYYEFRIAEKQEENEDGLVIGEKWLQYRHADNEIWNDIAPTKDFVDIETLLQLILSELEKSPNFKISPYSFSNTLDELDISESSTYPLVKYIKWSGIRGLTSSHDIEFTYSPDDETPTGRPRYLNVDNLIDKIKEEMREEIETSWLDKVYPKQSIFITMDDRDPSQILGGGEWQKIEGRFLLGAGTFNERNHTYSFQVNNKGGEVEHQLQYAEMPEHKHYQGTHWHNTVYSGRYVPTINGNSDWGYTSKRQMSYKSGNYFYPYTSTNTGGIGEEYYTGGEAPDISGAGMDEPHNNMPPYIVVNIWRRIN